MDVSDKVAPLPAIYSGTKTGTWPAWLAVCPSSFQFPGKCTENPRSAAQKGATIPPQHQQGHTHLHMGPKSHRHATPFRLWPLWCWREFKMACLLLLCPQPPGSPTPEKVQLRGSPGLHRKCFVCSGSARLFSVLGLAGGWARSSQD